MVDIEAMLKIRNITVHRGQVPAPYCAIYTKGADIHQPNVLTLSDRIKFSPQEELELFGYGISYNTTWSRFDQASWFGFQFTEPRSPEQKELQKIAAEILIELEELSAVLSNPSVGVADLARIFNCREELINVRMSCPDVIRLWNQKDGKFEPVLLHKEK